MRSDQLGKPPYPAFSPDSQYPSSPPSPDLVTDFYLRVYAPVAQRMAQMLSARMIQIRQLMGAYFPPYDPRLKPLPPPPPDYSGYRSNGQNQEEPFPPPPPPNEQTFGHQPPPAIHDAFDGYSENIPPNSPEAHFGGGEPFSNSAPTHFGNCAI